MILKCPHCNKSLSKTNKSLVCSNKHHFDCSKSGYVNLHISNQSRVHGDNKEMVQARTRFLASNHFQILKDTLNQEIQKIDPSLLLDLACGEGYYTKDFPCDEKYGIDLSKIAIQTASKHDKGSTYFVASIFDCPFIDESIDCITTVFAPIAENEIIRCLKKTGHFLCVSPAEDHLKELKESIYTHAYQNEKPHLLHALRLLDEIRITEKILLDSPSQIKDLFMMTPYYYKTSLIDKEKINHYSTLEVTIDFYIYHYAKD